MKFSLLKRAIPIVLFYFLPFCSPIQKTVIPVSVQYNSAKYQNEPITAAIEADEAILAFLKPYSDSIKLQMETRLGETKSDLTRTLPESSLGNIIAESLRDCASTILKTNVDIGIVNLGGLRTDVSAGDITVGTVYELMPFENKMIILTVTGQELQSILNDLAEIGGEPISGARFKIVNNVAKDIIVTGQPIDFNKTYTIATSDYLSNGGGSIKSLWTITNTKETNFLIRDIIVEYIKNRRVLDAKLDGRVR